MRLILFFAAALLQAQTVAPSILLCRDRRYNTAFCKPPSHPTARISLCGGHGAPAQSTIYFGPTGPSHCRRWRGVTCGRQALALRTDGQAARLSFRLRQRRNRLTAADDRAPTKVATARQLTHLKGLLGRTMVARRQTHAILFTEILRTPRTARSRCRPIPACSSSQIFGAAPQP